MDGGRKEVRKKEGKMRELREGEISSGYSVHVTSLSIRAAAEEEEEEEEEEERIKSKEKGSNAQRLSIKVVF
jgi:hypothetical protein